MKAKTLAKKILEGNVPDCLIKSYGKYAKCDVRKVAHRVSRYEYCGRVLHLLPILLVFAYIVWVSGNRRKATMLDITVVSGLMFLSVAGVYLQGEGIIGDLRNELERVSKILSVGDIETILSLVREQGKLYAGVHLTKQWLDILDRRKIVSLPLDMWPYFDAKLEYYNCFCSLLNLGLLSLSALSGSGWEEMNSVALSLQKKHRFFPGWFHKKLV